MAANELVIGVDGGGTKTVAWLEPLESPGASQPLGCGISGPGNPRAVGFDSALANIAAAVDDAFTRARLPPATVQGACLALAGADRPAEQSRLREWAAARTLADRLIVTNDAEPILATAPEQWGVALISGTGSLALGRSPNGNTARCGGWGYLLGDEGSGYAIALAGLRAATQAVDQRGDSTVLVDRFLRQLKIAIPQDLVGVVYGPGLARRQIADLADVVFQAARQQDSVAQQIVDQAASDLAGMARTVARRLDLPPDQFPLVLAGGVLIHYPELQDAVMRRLTESRYVPDRVALQPDPVRGAVALARRAAREAG